MPYYKEEFINRSTHSHSASGGNDSQFIVQDSSIMTSYRSRPHKGALTSTPVSDTSMDPYAYFLDNISRRRYHALLQERGLPAQGQPDKGHAFELRKHTLAGPLHRLPDKRGGAWEGALVYPPPTRNDSYDLNGVHEGWVNMPAPYKETGLDAYAQQAYSRVAPTSVVFDAAQFLGELREGLPRLSSELLKGGLKFYKGLGSDYLNIEFGWKPFINDIMNAAKALAGATDVLRQQGERVHRKHSAPLVQQSDVMSLSGGTLTVRSGVPNGLSPAALKAAGIENSSSTTSTGVCRYVIRKTRTVRRWFEGEFSSFYPLGFDPSNYFDRLNQLIKIKPDPATLWQLAPWSWLVDWNLRIGDSIAANQSAANDLLVMHYGYAMEHSVYTTDISWNLQSQGTYLTAPSRGGYFVSTEYKKRLRANPYGFKTGGFSSLTGGQATILGALGLTRLK